MKTRIKELRLERGVKQADLAKHIGVAQNTLSYWENGKYDVDNESLIRIADYFNVSTDYILLRENEKSLEITPKSANMKHLKELRLKKKLLQKDVADYLGVNRTTYVKYETGASQPDNDTLSRLADFFGVSVDYLLGRTHEKADTDFEKKFDNIFRIEKKKYPLLGDIACGEPIFADEEHESYVLAGSAVDADFCLRAKGDSMTGARIYDGDIVFVKQMPVVNNGDIAAVIIGDEATLKRVYYYPEKKKLVLNAENPRYEPFVYIGEELNEIRILGKAVAFQSILR